MNAFLQHNIIKSHVFSGEEEKIALTEEGRLLAQKHLDRKLNRQVQSDQEG